SLEYPRSWAFAMFGLYHRLKTEPNETLRACLCRLADRLVALYDANAAPEWRWFENELTYCNGKLPAALLLAHESTGEVRYRELGLAARTGRMTVLFDDAGNLRLVGQH